MGGVHAGELVEVESHQSIIELEVQAEVSHLGTQGGHQEKEYELLTTDPSF